MRTPWAMWIQSRSGLMFSHRPKPIPTPLTVSMKLSMGRVQKAYLPSPKLRGRHRVVLLRRGCRGRRLGGHSRVLHSLVRTMTAAIAAGRSFTLALLLFKQNTPLIQPFAGACRRRGGRRAEVKEPQDTAVENADLYRAADNAAHAITCIDSAMQSKRYWCIAERKRAFLHSNGTFRQVRMDAAPVPRRILQQIRLAMCPPISHSGRRSKPVQYCPHGTRNANVPVAPVDQGTSADDQLRPYERGE